MNLTHRTVLITGGTSGIGLEFARQLLALGNTVIVTGRDQARLKRTREMLPAVHAVRSDASDPGAMGTLCTEVIARFPTLDTLINNAGVMRNLKLEESRSPSDLTSEIDLLLKAPMWLVQELLPHLKTQRTALIVNVSSGLAFVPFPAAPVYSAAKAALHAYTRCLRAQLARSGITVVELAPPATETPLLRAEFAQEMRREKGMDAAVLVQRAIRAIQAGESEIRPGLSNVLKIASRLAPALMFRQMTRLSGLAPKSA